jgi:opacity protein-like surface antigen
MHTVFRHLLAIVVFFAVSSALPVYGQEPPSSPDEWEIRLMPYVWMPSIDADTTVNGLSGSVDVSFGDVLDDYLDFVMFGRGEAWKGKWGLTFDGVYFDLGMDSEFKGTRGATSFDLDIDLKLGMADFGLAYRLLEQVSAINPESKIIFEPYCGLRYAYLKQEADLNINIISVGPPGITLGKSEDWVEPFIGGRIICDLNDKMAINVRGDVGGFGIGSASRLTWNFVAGVDYKLSKKVSFDAGYRILDIDYSRGSGSDKFAADARLEGPVLGMTILF